MRPIMARALLLALAAAALALGALLSLGGGRARDLVARRFSAPGAEGPSPATAAAPSSTRAGGMLGAPSAARQLEGTTAQRPRHAKEETADGEVHVFTIGDWGTLLPNHMPAPNKRGGKKCPKECGYKYGIDDQAQVLVAEQMQNRALDSNPQYVLNVGDNFYWGGITQSCGAGKEQANGVTQEQFEYNWLSIYGNLTQKPWISALGNHDYGGWQFNMGWDQQIAYSSANSNWVMPARYYKQTMQHPGYTVDVFVIDSNAYDAKPPYEDPEHNICGQKHNPWGANCAAVDGPANPWHCYHWFWDTYRQQQRWLEHELSVSEADWQVVVTHFPCGHDSWWYKRLHQEFGLDLLVTGHRHDQELWAHHWSLGGLTCIVSGGGGGVTSEDVPQNEWTNQYGFFDLAFTNETIRVELVNLNGHVLTSTTVEPKDRV